MAETGKPISLCETEADDVTELEQHKAQILTVEEAKQLIEARRTEVIEACNAEINEVLKRHGCRIAVSVVIEPPNRVTPIVRIVAAD